MGESRRFRNSTSSSVENQLKTIKLRTRKIEKERVAIVYLGMNERYSDSFSCSKIESTSDSTKVTNRQKARFRNRGNMIWHGEWRVEYNAEVTSRVRWINCEIGRHVKGSVNHLLVLCARSLFALRTLWHHGLPRDALHPVFQATVVAKLSYTSPAWWRLTSAADRDRLEAFFDGRQPHYSYNAGHNLFWGCRQSIDTLFAAIALPPTVHHADH